MVPRDLPSMLFHILELKNPNSSSNFGLQSDPRRFFLIFIDLTFEFDLESQAQKSSMVPRDLPSMLFHILELKNPNSASNFGLQSDPRRFFLIFYHLTLNLTLKVKRKSRTMVPRDLPSMLFHILKLQQYHNSASNFGLQSRSPSFLLDFPLLDLEFDLEGQTQKSSMVPRDLPSMLFHNLEL